MKRKIKKIHIGKKLRRVLFIVTFIMICSLSFLLYREVAIPNIAEEKISLFSYTDKTKAGYRVYLVPNILYNSQSLEEGQLYLTNYIDYVKADFEYVFRGDRTADIKGDYELTAVIEAYEEDDETHITLWEKKYILLPKTDFTLKDSGMSLAKSVNLKLSEFNDFVAKVVEESKVDPMHQLIVQMNVNLTADTNVGTAASNKSAVIKIPLEVGYFSIAKIDAKEETGSIEKTQSVQLPMNKKMVILYSCILGLLILVVPGLVFFSEGISKDPFAKKVNKIFKHHGSRLVALDSELLAACLDSCSKVKAIDDLVRISDEIGKPIMYEYNENCKEIIQFYVIDDKRTYLYVLRDSSVRSDTSIIEGKEVVV